MRPTRRLWSVGGLALIVTVLAIIFARPLLLVATAMIGAWILVRQYLFITTVAETLDSLSVTQSVPSMAVRTDGTTPVTLVAERSATTALSLTLDAGIPTAGRSYKPLSVSLGPAESTAERTEIIEWPIAGRHEFDEVTLTASDGLFEATVGVGPTPAVTVEPRGPRNVHVGAGGDYVAIAQGAHQAGRLKSGLEPAEIREYVSGDTADQIDWNATARFATPHVREYETETDRPTVLVVDHRSALTTGPADETKLDYLREVALGITESAHRLDDPLGLVTIGEDGITNRIAKSTTRYRTIRRRLFDLEATKPETERSVSKTRMPTRSAATAPRSALDRLAVDGETGFARSLAPFYRNRQLTHERIDAEPLLAGVRLGTSRQREKTWTVICTDDSDPTAVLDAVGLARANGNDVLVILAPTVLFEPSGMSDVERAYDRYVSFETFRQELDAIDQVRALEVAPGDRLATILAAGTGRRLRGVRQ